MYSFFRQSCLLLQKSQKAECELVSGVALFDFAAVIGAIFFGTDEVFVVFVFCFIFISKAHSVSITPSGFIVDFSFKAQDFLIMSNVARLTSGKLLQDKNTGIVISTFLLKISLLEK